MQSVSDSFSINSKKNIRHPSKQVLIDWNLDGIYDDESANILSLEGERIISEPLGGVNQAQMDIKLSNIAHRYSPNSLSELAEFIALGRRIKILTGFNNENIPFSRGISDIPILDEENREVSIHFWDELENLSNYNLPDGSKLYLDTRTDLYIWDILDVVYKNWFQVISSFNSDETWVGGEVEIINRRGGDQAIRLDSTFLPTWDSLTYDWDSILIDWSDTTSGSFSRAYMDTSLDLTGYGAAWDSNIYDWDSLLSSWSDTDLGYTDDNISFFLFIEDLTKIQTLTIRLHNIIDEAYADLDITKLAVTTGWNQLVIPKSSFVSIDSSHPPSTWFKIGTSTIGGGDSIAGGVFDFSSIVRVELIMESNLLGTTYVIFDELRLTHQFNYPRRFIDMGLQNIPVAEFGGNTALFEIQTACEAEGARLYSDEEGQLHFENRQYYNNTPSKKISVGQLSFERLTKYDNPKPDQGMINSVVVTINPRKIVAQKDIWQYGEIVKINNGETITIWASFTDPVPTTITGLVTPVATTDYTANDDIAGGGTDRTSNISISITKFTSSAKLDITNTYSSPIYLTLLKLRGTPAETQSPILIKSNDPVSIATYGEFKLDVQNKYLASTDYAQILSDQLVTWYKNPIDRIQINHPALPQLQIGDMISILNGYTNSERLMRFMGISFSLNNDTMFEQSNHLRAVQPFELLTFFEIGTSIIGGTDVISD